MSVKNARMSWTFLWVVVYLALSVPAAAVDDHFVGVFSPLNGSVPTEEIIPDVPIDAIPPLVEPAFLPAAATVVVKDNDLVLGVVINGEAFAYPNKIMNFHEIVEHEVGGRPIIATFCPLTNSGVILQGGDISFGNTGALFNNNVVMYDLETRSFWSQMALGCIFGERAGEHLQTLPGVQATWGAWKALYPDTQILSEETGFARNYANDPFVIFGYSENEDIFFVQEPPIDRRLHPKAMVYGLAVNGKARAYPYELLAETNVVNDHFGEDVLIVYHPEGQMPLGYVRRFGDTTYHFSAVDTDDKGFPLLVDAETGSTWNVLGVAIDGPLAGQQLTPIASYSAYWFGWASFWEGTDIWDGSSIAPPPMDTAVEVQSWGQVKAEATTSGQ